MFIAFEGPDNTGKSTTAENLDCAGQPDYNVTKKMHAQNVAEFQGDPLMPHTYDRIDWFSHMVYRLALPDHEWNDDRPRTVFAMPETHLVVKLHHPELAGLIADELYTTGTLAKVNPMYYYFADFFTGLNEERDFALFKTISIIEVRNDTAAGTFTQSLASFSSPVTEWQDAMSRGIDSDESLLELLYEEEQRR